MKELDLVVYGTRHFGHCSLINRRRPLTSYSDRNFSPSPRIRSAQYRPEAVVMPRSHVSVARFYDWSEDLGECVSVSKFYRDLARNSKLGSERLKNKHWCSNGVHINPGRMFLRDKAGLTKGEREIIEGIYRNRGDGQSNNNNSLSGSSEELQVVRSHKDAWLVNKHHHNNTNNNHSKGLFKSTDSIESLRMPEKPFSRSSETRREICASFIESLPPPMLGHGQISGAGDKAQERVLIAPPSTPDRENSSSETSETLSSSHTATGSGNKHSSGSQSTKRRVFRCGEGPITVETNRKSIQPKTLQKIKKDSNTNHVSEKHEAVQLVDDKKKVFVNVFLPQTSQEMSRETTSVTQDGAVSPILLMSQKDDRVKNTHKSSFSKNLRSPRDSPSVRFTTASDNRDFKKPLK